LGFISFSPAGLFSIRRSILTSFFSRLISESAIRAIKLVSPKKLSIRKFDIIVIPCMIFFCKQFR
jgi:hypothetical protein